MGNRTRARGKNQPAGCILKVNKDLPEPLSRLGVLVKVNNRSEAAPFIAAVCLFTMSYLGIAISLWPFIVPYRFTLWQAASSPSTQAFILVGVLVLLPVTLLYTAWS